MSDEPMLGIYRLEVLTATGWSIAYEGDDPGAYMKATFKASFAGETTRATNIGHARDTPRPTHP